MKKFIIERKIPGAGNMTTEELQDVARTSNAVILLLGKPYHWIQSYVTEDKLYCIHEVENEDDILQHAKCGDFPVTRIEEIRVIIDPTTAHQARNGNCTHGKESSYNSGLSTDTGTILIR